MAKIKLKNLTVTYPAKKGLEYVCLDCLNASFSPSKVNVILGESGSGKSTLLKAVAGILPYEGEIVFDGKNAAKLSAKEKNVAFVDQEITLYPNRPIFDNLALPLRFGKLTPEDIRKKVFSTAKSLGITSTLSRLPRQISIGQQQRACLGKALVKNPDVLLLDEPFSNIDEARRKEERELLKRLVKGNNITVILSTHLEEDVLSLGEDIFLLEDGKVSLSLTKEQMHTSTHPLIRAMLSAHIGEDAHG